MKVLWTKNSAATPHSQLKLVFEGAFVGDDGQTVGVGGFDAAYNAGFDAETLGYVDYGLGILVRPSRYPLYDTDPMEAPDRNRASDREAQ